MWALCKTTSKKHQHFDYVARIFQIKTYSLFAKRYKHKQSHPYIEYMMWWKENIRIQKKMKAKTLNICNSSRNVEIISRK